MCIGQGYVYVSTLDKREHLCVRTGVFCGQERRYMNFGAWGAGSHSSDANIVFQTF